MFLWFLLVFVEFFEVVVGCSYTAPRESTTNFYLSINVKENVFLQSMTKIVTQR